MTVNTRVLVNDFEYIVPSSLPEALGLLDRYGKDANHCPTAVLAQRAIHRPALRCREWKNIARRSLESHKRVIGLVYAYH